MAYKYSLRASDGSPIEFESETMLTRDQAKEYAAQLYNQRWAEQQQLEQTAEESRGVGGTLRDTALGLSAGVLGPIGEDLIGGGLTLLGAEELGEAARETFGGDAERLREMQTPQIQARQQLAQQRIQDVEGEGFIPEATTAVSEYLSNPSLLFQLGTEQLPQLIPIARAGRLTRGVASRALKDATEQTLNRAGLGGAASAAGALQGSSVGMETYDRVYEQGIEQGLSEADASEQALRAAQQDALQSGALTVGTTFAIPGAGTVERAVLGRAATDAGQQAARRFPTLRGAGRGAAGEATQEGIEEGGGAYISNISAIEAGEDIDPLTGVGAQAGIGSLLGAGFGGVTGAVQGRRDERVRQENELLRQAQEEQEAQQQAERQARGEMDQQDLPGFEPGALPEVDGPPAPEPSPAPEFELEPTADLETTERQGELDLDQPAPTQPARVPTGQRGFDFRSDQEQLDAVERELAEFDQTYGTLPRNEQRQVRQGLQQERDRLRNRRILDPRPAEESAQTFQEGQPDLLGFYQPEPETTGAVEAEADTRADAQERIDAGRRRRQGETFGGPQRELELGRPVEPVTLTEERLAEFGLPALARRPDRVRANFKNIARRFEGLDLTDPQQRQQAQEQLEDVENRYSGSWVGPFSERMRGELQATEQQTEAVQAERERIGLEREQAPRRAIQEDVDFAIERGLQEEQTARAQTEQEQRRAALRQQLVDRQAERVREQATGRIPLTEDWKRAARTQLSQRQEEAQMRERGLDEMAAQEAADFELDMQYVDERTPQLEPDQKVAASDFVQQYTEAQAINDPQLTQAVEQEARSQLGSQQWGRLKSGLSSQRRAQQRRLEQEQAGETQPEQPDLLAQPEPETTPEPTTEPAPAAEPVQGELFDAAETATEAAQDAERAADTAERAAEQAGDRRPSRRAVRGEQEPAADEQPTEPSVDVDGQRDQSRAAPEPESREERGVGRDSVPPSRREAGAEPSDVTLDEELPAVAVPLQRAFNAPTEANTNALLNQANQDGVLSDEQLEDFRQKIQQGEQARAKAIMHVYNEVRDYEYFTANPSVALSMSRQVKPIRQAAGLTRAADQETVDREVDQEIGPVDDDTDIVFSRAPYQDKKLATVEEVEAEIKPILKNVPKEFTVNVVQSRTDLPSELSVPNNVRGVYQNGTIYIIADATSAFDAQTVLAHELVGHAGMEGILGRPAFNNLVNQINNLKETNPRIREILENIRREYTNNQGEYQLDANQEAREIIAHIAEAKPQYLTDSGVRRVWNNIVRRVRNALTKLGFINPSDNLLDQLVYEAALHAQGGGSATRTGRVFLRPETMAAHTMQRAWDKGYRGFDVQEAGRHLRGVADGSISVLDRTAEDVFNEPTDDSYLDVPAFSRQETADAPVNDGYDAVVSDVAPRDVEKPNRLRQLVETLRGPQRLFDTFRVKMVDAASTYEDKMRGEWVNGLRNAQGEITPMVSYVQSLRSEGLAAMVLREGSLIWNEATNLWTAERKKGNPSLTDAFHDVNLLGQRIGQKAAMDRAHAAFMARRELAIEEANRNFQRDADQARARGNTKLANKLEEKIVDMFPGQNADFYAQRMAENRKRMELFSTYPELESAFNNFTKFKNNLLDAMVESGVLSQEKATDFKNNIDYVPFNRILETSQGEDVGGYEINTTGLMQTGTFRQLQGSAKDINNIMDNMAKLSIWMTQAAVRNQAAKQLIRGMRKVDGIEAEYQNTNEVPAADRPHLVSFRDNGKVRFFKLKDPLDAYAWRGTESLNMPALRLLSAPADWLRKGITLSPDFILSQLQQDTFRVYSFAGLKNPARGAARVAGNWWRIRDDLRQGRFGDAGMNRYGILGQYDYMPEQTRRDVEADVTGQDIGRLGRVIRFGERNAEASDLAQRKAVFDQTLADTNGDEVMAFWRASEIINFNRRGVSPVASVLRQIIPFQNAYMQGMNVLGKSLAGRGISQAERSQAFRIFYSTVGKLAALSAMYAVMMSDDEDYLNQPSHIRSRYFNIPTGDGLPGLKMAMPADLAFLAKSLPETAVLQIMRDDQDSEKVARELRDAFVTAISGPNMTPQTVKPFLEVATNYSFFRSGPIVGMGEQMREIEDQYRDSTSELAKLIGQSLGYSPLKVDHLLRGYFGTLGSTALTMTDIPYEVATGEKTPRRELADYPVARTLFSRTSGTGFKEDFYNLRDDVRSAVTSLNLRQKQGDMEGAQELVEDSRRLLALRRQVNQVENTIEKSNRRIRQITDSDLSPDEKRERIDRERDFQARLASQVRRMRSFAYDE